MQVDPNGRSLGVSRLRVLLVDDHAVSRAACRALLRTEGVEVVADFAVGGCAIAAVGGLGPDAVIVDVHPENDRALALARRLRELRCAPTIVLTSSAEPKMFEAKLGGFAFVVKADLCASEVARAVRTKSQ